MLVPTKRDDNGPPLDGLFYLKFLERQARWIKLSMYDTCLNPLIGRGFINIAF
jgi:hypothetical protein